MVQTSTRIIAPNVSKEKLFIIDNVPDALSEGLFRIIRNNQIGYADAVTGEIVIKPRFACAFPLENGTAKVSDSCEFRAVGEYHRCITHDKSNNTLSNINSNKVKLFFLFPAKNFFPNLPEKRSFGIKICKGSVLLLILCPFYKIKPI